MPITRSRHVSKYRTEKIPSPPLRIPENKNPEP
jgi:hypothetical protein